jgi:hypothetical protein
MSKKQTKQIRKTARRKAKQIAENRKGLKAISDIRFMVNRNILYESDLLLFGSLLRGRKNDRI